MGKIKIITDSTSDVTLNEAEKYGIEILGQTILFGDKSYTETLELSADDFWVKLKEFGGIPKTSQINITKFTECYEKYKDMQMIYIAISGKSSGTIQSATLAKNMFLEENPEADITIIDSEKFAYGYGYWVVKAAIMANEGKTKEEIVKAVTEGLAKTEVLFAVDDLTFLQKGGRISPAAKIVGNLLDIKPILSVVDGLILNVAKVRGSKKMYAKIAEMMLENGDDLENQTINILHCNNEDMIEKMENAISAKVNVKGFERRIVGGTVGTNTGPGVIAVTYIKKLS